MRCLLLLSLTLSSCGPHWARASTSSADSQAAAALALAAASVQAAPAAPPAEDRSPACTCAVCKCDPCACKPKPRPKPAVDDTPTFPRPAGDGWQWDAARQVWWRPLPAPPAVLPTLTVPTPTYYPVQSAAPMAAAGCRT